MQRAEVNVEVCHVEEQGKSAKKRQSKRKKKSGKSQATRKKSKSSDSDRETEMAAADWEEEDELNASQYLQEQESHCHPDLTMIGKRSADETLPPEPVAKRARSAAPCA